MSTIDGTGRVVRSAAGVEVRFVRTYAVPPDTLWKVLTDPDELARWFGRWSGDPATGTVHMLMSAEGDGPPEPVQIDACDRPRHLAVTVTGPDGAWPLVVDLAERAGGTELRFSHRLAEPYDAGSIGPGWHFYLDRLDAVVRGAPVPDAWDDYYPALAGAYEVPPEATDADAPG